MDLGLKGKVALVTGGSRGIGRAIARALGGEGARVCVGARGEEGLAEVAEELRALGAEVATCAADISRPEGAAALVCAAIDAFGALDVLVNNAGGSLGSGPFEATDADKWAAVFDLNLMSAVWCSQHATRHMIERGAGGSVVHVSSICGREYCTSSPYMAAKAAMIAMGKEMSVSLAKHRIRVNTVAPGSIRFPGGSWDRRTKDDPERIEKMIDEELPWRRFGAPEEIASVVAFLASERASWVTGACVPIDGAQGRAL